MKASWKSVLGLLVALESYVVAQDAAALFDGKTLKGWSTVERDRKFWRVEGGVIMADSLGKKMPRNTFLFSEGEYDDFEFRCMFRLTGDPKTGLVNSGIQFRSARHGNGHAKGYQADIGEPNWWGCIYDEGRRGLIGRSEVKKLRGSLQPFGWNEYVIRAQGPVIRLFINGIQTMEFLEKDPAIPDKGRIALQLHSGGVCRIEYKDISLRPMPALPAKAAGPNAQSASKPKKPKPKAAGKASSKIETRRHRDDVVFADFESGTYQGWVAEGTAFGKRPLKVSETPGYQGDLNAHGKYCVNSHASAGSSDAATGTLTSVSFKVTHDYLWMRIGGGKHQGRTCVKLLVDGKPAKKELTGNNHNTMRVKFFSTKPHKGKMAQIQIVDAERGGWGNIGVDEIIFSNVKPKPAAKKKVGKKTQSGRSKAYSPEKQLAGFKVPDGFVVELVASEEHGVINPIDLTFDDAGRLWTNTAKMYPLDPDPGATWSQTLKYMNNPSLQAAEPNFSKVRQVYEGKRRGEDQLLIIEDPTAEPRPATVWADGLAMPQSFLPYKNGAFVAHGSEMIFLEDSDGDGKADRRSSVLSGFGYTDTHTMSHLLVRAPGGWVNYSHGALNKGDVVTVKTGERNRVDNAKIGRFSLDGRRHEVIVAGLNNIWGYTLRANGQWFGSEANDQGHAVTPMEAGTAYSGIGKARLRSYQPFLPPPNRFRVGGTGLSGLAFSDDADEGYPEDWRGVAFLANPITCKINAVLTVRNPDGTVSSKRIGDFLDSEDDWFRPVNLEFGPDGCLYVADFYNKIISHNEVSRTHPDRDKLHGRIWRIRYTGAKPSTVQNFYKLPTAELPAQLKSPRLWAKRAAWHQIVDRGARELTSAVAAICRDEAQDEATRIIALWSLEGLQQYDRDLMARLLKSELSDLRREAVRAMATLPVRPEELAAMLAPLEQESNVMVRSQLLRTLAEYGRATPDLIDLAVKFCLPDSKSGKLGGGYERKFERYLARKALEQYPVGLGNYLDSGLAKRQPESHLIWAAQALPSAEREVAFLQQWESRQQEPLDESTFKLVCSMLRNPKVFAAVKPVFDGAGSGYLVELALTHQAETLSPQLSQLLASACGRLLGSGEAAKVALGARAADRLRVPDQDPALASLLKAGSGAAAVLVDAVQVLARDPQHNGAVLIGSLNSGVLSSAAAMVAVAAVAKVDAAAAEQHAAVLAERLVESDQSVLIGRLLSSAAGSRIVLRFMSRGLLKESALDLASALRLQQQLGDDDQAARWVATRRRAAAAERKAFATKLERLMAVAAKKGGDPTKGEPFFKALCLSCHAVGATGAGFAPALDGSAHRDPEGLLTAILNPDAAVEGSYALYRILKTDSSTVEGYLEKDDARGATMRFMGGASLFIPKTEIASASFVAGRSVMPRGLIDGFSEAQVADLLAYIRSLK